MLIVILKSFHHSNNICYECVADTTSQRFLVDSEDFNKPCFSIKSTPLLSSAVGCSAICFTRIFFSYSASDTEVRYDNLPSNKVDIV